MQENWKDEMLSGDRIDKASGGSAFEVDLERKMLPGQLQCTKCGRLVLKEDFFAVLKCPDCGGGMFKAVCNS